MGKPINVINRDRNVIILEVNRRKWLDDIVELGQVFGYLPDGDTDYPKSYTIETNESGRYELVFMSNTEAETFEEMIQKAENFTTY